MGDCRRIGVAVDFSPCSRKALKWAVENLTRKGDHLILVAVRPEGYYESGEMQLWEATGSRMHLITPYLYLSLFDPLFSVTLWSASVHVKFDLNTCYDMNDFIPLIPLLIWKLNPIKITFCPFWWLHVIFVCIMWINQYLTI